MENYVYLKIDQTKLDSYLLCWCGEGRSTLLVDDNEFSYITYENSPKQIKLEVLEVESNKLKPSMYTHVMEIRWFGKLLKSSYNHNYYYSKVYKDLILEECDDADEFVYYRINNTNSEVNFIGTYQGVTGIFDENNNVIDNFGYIELEFL